MTDKCRDCPKLIGKYPVGKCPACGKDGLYMDVNSHVAICPQCGEDFGIPLAVRGRCERDIRYEVLINGEIPHKTLLELSKTIGISSTYIYNELKNGSTLRIENKSIMDVYRIKHLAEDTGIHIKTMPELDKYSNFDKCWNWLRRTTND